MIKLFSKKNQQKILFIIVLSIIAIQMTGCAKTQPRNISNACEIIHQYPDWYYDMLDSYNRWGVPISIQMAFIRQESSFKAGAKPPMQWFLGFIPTGRASTAYGYAQALDGTWNHYKRETKQKFVSRSNFADATDFIGWYVNNTHTKIGTSKRNAYALYLAYHEGITGYKRGRHVGNTFLLSYAKKTQNWAYTYANQLKTCAIPYRSWFSYIF